MTKKHDFSQGMIFVERPSKTNIMFHKFLILLSIPLLFFMSCEDVQIDPNGMGISVQIDSSSNSALNIQIDEAYMRISEIEFEGELTDDQEIEVESSIETVLDLLTGTANPALPNVQIPAGLYEEFEIDVEGADDGGTVFFLKGSLTDSAQNTFNVELDVQEQFNLELEYENFQVDSAMTFGATFIINPAAWFLNLTIQELATATVDANGLILIDPNNNTAIYNKIVDNIDDGIEWEWDD
ncbi:MAG: hypothetical protein AAFR87_16730 [Bacteroidota bacterium]